jgi:hypothetical protein
VPAAIAHTGLVVAVLVAIIVVGLLVELSIRRTRRR